MKACPSCGGVLELVEPPFGYAVQIIAPAVNARGVDGLVERAKLSAFVACSGCEYCKEIRK